MQRIRPTLMFSWSVALLFQAISCVRSIHTTAREHPAVEVSPTIMLLGEFDWQTYVPGGSSSRCTLMVDSAIKYGSSRLNFVPTHYYIPTSDGGISGYCYMDSNYKSCKSFTQAAIQAFLSGLSLCLDHAASRGIRSISITPHVDISSSGSTWTVRSWRNGIVFSPKNRYSGYSYEEIMLRPVATALGLALPSSMPIYFALQGEMGATFFRYPKEYRSLLVSMREVVAAARQHKVSASSSSASQAVGPVKMGATFNYIFIDGNQSPDNRAAQQNAFGPYGPLWAFFLGPLYAQAPQNTPPFDKKSVQDLFADLDFIGLSAYSGLSKVDFSETELQNSAESFFKEALSAIGLDLRGLMHKKGMELQYAEYGLGGGSGDSGSEPAASALQVVERPYWGVFGSYQKSKDPWQLTANRQILIQFWRKTADWLRKGGGPKVSITACYMWNMASWDVLAIYPESTSQQGSYKNLDVARIIQEHNQYVHSLEG